MTPTAAFLSELREAALWVEAHEDGGPYRLDGAAPAAVVHARSDADVARALSAASEHDLAVAFFGGRTTLSLGMPPDRYDLAIDLSQLTEVAAYEPNDFTIAVGAGTTLAQLQRTLAEHGQFVPLDAPHFERATVGGVAAVGRGGLRRTAFGGPRDWLIGMRMVRADGQQIKGGGQVVKNVSGYDLPKLFAGSMGTLGAIVEVTLKLRPLPAADRVITIGAPSFGDALTAAFAAAQAAHRRSMAVWRCPRNPRRRHGRWVQRGLSEQPTLILRAAGLESAVGEVLADAVGGGAPERPGWPGADHAGHLRDLASCRRPRTGNPRRPNPTAARSPACIPGRGAADAGRTSPIYRPVGRGGGFRVAVRRCAARRRSTCSQESSSRFAPSWRHSALISPSSRRRWSSSRLIDIWGPAGPGGRLMRSIKQQFDPTGHPQSGSVRRRHLVAYEHGDR